MNETVFRGRIWKCLDNVLVYSILPQKYLFKEMSASLDELKQHVMEDIDPYFAKEALQGKYKMIVAGKNFGGGGKSLEHPVLAIKGLGINVVIADSFSRYFFRNAINNGLPVIECKGITKLADTGDELEVNLRNGEIKNLTRKESTKASPLPNFIINLISSGGYIEYIRKKLEKEVQ